MSLPDIECPECDYSEKIQPGKQMLNPRLRDCPECGASGLEVNR
ncbi:hypothetical protein [Halorussus salinus]|nr:hypothetical protein [Halorussus salinus]